jgi:hypothetical protein
MRRVEIANRFAVAAREAERSGKHRKAAELYAEALRILLDRAPMNPGQGEEVYAEVGAPVSEARETAYAPSDVSSDDTTELPRVG